MSGLYFAERVSDSCTLGRSAPVKSASAPRTLLWAGMSSDAAASMSTAGGVTGSASRATISVYASFSAAGRADVSPAAGLEPGLTGGAVAHAVAHNATISRTPFTPASAFDFEIDRERLHVRNIGELDHLLLRLHHAFFVLKGYRNAQAGRLRQHARRHGQRQRLVHLALPRMQQRVERRDFFLRRFRRRLRGLLSQHLELRHDVDRRAHLDVLDLRLLRRLGQLAEVDLRLGPRR